MVLTSLTGRPHTRHRRDGRRSPSFLVGALGGTAVRLAATARAAVAGELTRTNVLISGRACIEGEVAEGAEEMGKGFGAIHLTEFSQLGGPAIVVRSRKRIFDARTVHVNNLVGRRDRRLGGP